jgi:ATP phosphoribosyltransferase regulatory subunit HisZ
MAYQEYVQKAIATGKAYDELPAKVKGAVPLQEWKTR